MVMNENLVAKPWVVEKVGFGAKPLVLSIDQQKFFTTEESPFKIAKMPGFDLVRRAITGQRKLMDAARVKNIQIVHTVIGFRKDGKDKGLWKVPEFVNQCIVGSKWMDVDEELEVREEDIVFVRKKPSAFFGTPLLEIMIANRFDTLIITGQNTSGCVRATTNESFMYGFNTIIPEDCVGDLTGEGPHWANLSDVNGRYADVIPLDDLLSYFDRLP
jgi:maleamate amidohydrolase